MCLPMSNELDLLLEDCDRFLLFLLLLYVERLLELDLEREWPRECFDLLDREREVDRRLDLLSYRSLETLLE